MSLYYVVRNQVVESEKMINFDFFKNKPFKIDREFTYYNTLTLNLKLEGISCFIYNEKQVLKDTLPDNSFVLNVINNYISQS